MMSQGRWRDRWDFEFAFMKRDGPRAEARQRRPLKRSPGPLGLMPGGLYIILYYSLFTEPKFRPGVRWQIIRSPFCAI